MTPGEMKEEWERERIADRKLREEAIARDIERHTANQADITDAIRHRAAVDAVQTEWLAIMRSGNVIQERIATALERLVDK